MAVNVNAMTAFARKVVRGNTGYDQGQRWSFYDRATDTFIPNRETDCSAKCGAIARQGTRKVDLGTSHAGFYTGNFEAVLVGTGEFIGMAYPGAGAVREGDFLLKPGHVAYAVNPTFIAEAYIDEYGNIVGGKAGAQAGWETRIVTNYGGWTRLVRPKTITTNEEDELNATEKKQLADIHAAVASADGRKAAVRIRNVLDILTGFKDNQYVQKGYSLPLIGMRVRDIKDYLSGGGPRGNDETLLRDIVNTQQLILARLDKLEGK